jgi:hypothetical protein
MLCSRDRPADRAPALERAAGARHAAHRHARAQLDAALVRRVEQNVARFQAGEPLLGVIDPVAGY